MGEEHHRSGPDAGLVDPEMGLHGLPRLIAKGGCEGQRQQEGMGLTGAESQALADLLEDLLRRDVTLKGPPWGVHHRHLRFGLKQIRRFKAVWETPTGVCVLAIRI